MMKRLGLSVVLLLAAATAGWAAWFFHNNLRGAGPSVLGATRDIASLIATGKSPLSCPAGFELSIFASGVGGARVMARDPNGTLLVSRTRAGMVVALPDSDGDGRADRVVPVLTGLNLPHGLAFSPGPDKRLFVAETGRVTAYPYDPQTLRVGPGDKIADLPPGGRHSTRSLLFMPPPHQDTLLISVGSSCNACREEDWRRAKILSLNLRDRTLKPFASGLRNAVFMTVNPRTKEIWATEMGRDYLGDDLPPDEIDRIVAGGDYGWPFCYGDNRPDSEFAGSGDSAEACRGKIPPLIDIPAHSAPLGLAFFPDRGWPEEYRGNLLVAYHGSWNRTVPTGYKVVRFRFDTMGKPLGQEEFISGWLQGGESAYGRPVDILITKEGVISISDDKAGVIYRLIAKRHP
jgi:glucose/arabinose dehydrogenase